jgi:DoxX-like family
MKRNTIYWLATAFVSTIMGISGTLAAVHAPPMMKALGHLGYPSYFANILGIAKLTGVAVFQIPGAVRLKEWAYAGFGVTVLCATYSHWSSGDGLMALEPLLTFGALVISYITRADDRRMGCSIWSVQ